MMNGNGDFVALESLSGYHRFRIETRIGGSAQSLDPPCIGTTSESTSELAMPNYRRLYIPGGTYFFTLVTHARRPLFSQASWRTSLRLAIETIQSNRPFTIEAFVLLPDHLHCIWTLPPSDADYSNRWRPHQGRVHRRLSRKRRQGDSKSASLDPTEPNAAFGSDDSGSTPVGIKTT